MFRQDIIWCLAVGCEGCEEHKGVEGWVGGDEENKAKEDKGLELSLIHI